MATPPQTKDAASQRRIDELADALLPLMRGRRELPEIWQSKRPSDALVTPRGHSSF